MVSKMAAKDRSSFSRDSYPLHLLHIIVPKQGTVLEPFLNLGERRFLHVLADSASKAFEAISRLRDVDRDALRESFVENLADKRHFACAGLGVDCSSRALVEVFMYSMTSTFT
jgi:hypothetical protein